MELTVKHEHTISLGSKYHRSQYTKSHIEALILPIEII